MLLMVMLTQIMVRMMIMMVLKMTMTSVERGEREQAS
jgi:hypothetical protein